MKSRLVSIMLIILFVPAMLSAQEEKFTFVKANEIAKYSGYLFSPEAMSKMLSEQQAKFQEQQVIYEKTINKLNAEHELELGKVSLSLEMKNKEYDSIVSAKDKQIESMNKMIVQRI